jgi:hypothetical protein
MKRFTGIPVVAFVSLVTCISAHERRNYSRISFPPACWMNTVNQSTLLCTKRHIRSPAPIHTRQKHFCHLCSSHLQVQKKCFQRSIRQGIVQLNSKRIRKFSSENNVSNRIGFGVASRSQSLPKQNAKFDDDYSIFPALDASVQATLLPASTAFAPAASSGLSVEIKARLSQIYGFPKFNYESNEFDSQNIDGMNIIDALVATEMPLVRPTPILSTAHASALSLEALPNFPNIQALHVDPMVLSIPHFFTAEECDRYVALCTKKVQGNMSTNAPNQLYDHDVMQSRSPTVGKDVTAKAQRTSTTFYHHYRNVPELMAKASRLLGLDNIDCWEEPQTVRYQPLEKFTWHLDALGPNEISLLKSGQRIATLLVYLTDLDDSMGGATIFRDLYETIVPIPQHLTSSRRQLQIQPTKGTALLFFPAAGGISETPYDIRTLHCGEMIHRNATNDKWIAQLWLRTKPYMATAPPGNCASDPRAIHSIQQYCSNAPFKS